MGSLEKLGYSYEVLAYRMPWENLRAKIQYYLEGAKAHEAAAGPNALAAFVDGFDVLAVLDAATLVKRYREKPRPMPIVFGAEIWCLGNCNKDVIDWYTHHQIRGGRGAIEPTFEDFGDGYSVKVPQPTFMNTGFVLGPVGKIRELYEGILATPYEVDDQYTTGIYVQKHFDMIDLDMEERFMRNKLATRDKLPDEGTDAGPVFLHFPGSRDDNDQAALLERFKGYETGA